jgi:hypothetical protein
MAYRRQYELLCRASAVSGQIEWLTAENMSCHNRQIFELYAAVSMNCFAARMQLAYQYFDSNLFFSVFRSKCLK